MLSRRQILKASALGASAAGLSSIPLASKLFAATPRTDIIAQHISHKLGTNQMETENMFSFGSGMPETIRMKQGEPFHGHLINNLKEPTTVRWHGFRVP